MCTLLSAWRTYWCLKMKKMFHFENVYFLESHILFLYFLFCHLMWLLLLSWDLTCCTFLLKVCSFYTLDHSLLFIVASMRILPYILSFNQQCTRWKWSLIFVIPFKVENILCTCCCVCGGCFFKFYFLLYNMTVQWFLARELDSSCS